MDRKSSLDERCIGRWKSLLPMLGLDSRFLRNRHGPCPFCGGDDRYRFDDKEGRGTWICSHCGSGNGISLAMRLKGADFKAIAQEIERLLPDTVAFVPSARRSDDEKRKGVDAIWRRSHPLNGLDAASRYLQRRGLSMQTWPTQLRFLPNAKYVHDDKTITQHPAMVAQMVGPDLIGRTVHLTFLTEDGRKADLPKTKKLAPAPIPVGGAVRLSPSAEVMGIAEGIETAMSAARLFSMPVWAALSADCMLKFQPPQHVRKLFVFGDNDASFTGQHVAYGLAYKLRSRDKRIEIHPTFPEEADVDWNDVLLAEYGSQFADDEQALV